MALEREAEDLRERVRKLTAEANQLRKDTVGSGRLLRKAQVELEQKVKDFDELEKEAKSKDSLAEEQRKKLSDATTQVKRLQRLQRPRGDGDAPGASGAASAAASGALEAKDKELAELRKQMDAEATSMKEASASASREAKAAEAAAEAKLSRLARRVEELEAAEVAAKDGAGNAAEMTETIRELQGKNAAIERELSQWRAVLEQQRKAKDEAVQELEELKRGSQALASLSTIPESFDGREGQAEGEQALADLRAALDAERMAKDEALSLAAEMQAIADGHGGDDVVRAEFQEQIRVIRAERDEETRAKEDLVQRVHELVSQLQEERLLARDVVAQPLPTTAEGDSEAAEAAAHAAEAAAQASSMRIAKLEELLDREATGAANLREKLRQETQVKDEALAKLSLVSDEASARAEGLEGRYQQLRQVVDTQAVDLEQHERLAAQTAELLTQKDLELAALEERLSAAGRASSHEASSTLRDTLQDARDARDEAEASYRAREQAAQALADVSRRLEDASMLLEEKARALHEREGQCQHLQQVVQAQAERLETLERQPPAGGGHARELEEALQQAAQARAEASSARSQAEHVSLAVEKMDAELAELQGSFDEESAARRQAEAVAEAASRRLAEREATVVDLEETLMAQAEQNQALAKSRQATVVDLEETLMAQAEQNQALARSVTPPVPGPFFRSASVPLRPATQAWSPAAPVYSAAPPVVIEDGPGPVPNLSRQASDPPRSFQELLQALRSK